MKKYLIYGAVFTALAFVAGGTIGIGIALLGGLFSTISALRKYKDEVGCHANTSVVLSENEALLTKYEAMINRLQIDCSHKDDVIRGYQQKEADTKKLDEAIKELPVAKEPRKKATKKTK